MGATAEERKELFGCHDGQRESEKSWTGVLLDLKCRSLSSGAQPAP